MATKYKYEKGRIVLCAQGNHESTPCAKNQKRAPVCRVLAEKPQFGLKQHEKQSGKGRLPKSELSALERTMTRHGVPLGNFRGVFIHGKAGERREVVVYSLKIAPAVEGGTSAFKFKPTLLLNQVEE